MTTGAQTDVEFDASDEPPDLVSHMNRRMSPGVEDVTLVTDGEAVSVEDHAEDRLYFLTGHRLFVRRTQKDVVAGIDRLKEVRSAIACQLDVDEMSRYG